MATPVDKPNENSSSNAEQWKKQVMLGKLPESFLKVGSAIERQQIDQDAEIAQAYAQQMAYHMQVGGGQAGQGFQPASATGRLSMTISQAKLVKNYGMMGMRMDPYCRIRIGNTVLETHTDHNGAKNPHWNKTMQCYVDSSSIKTIYVEIFDEKALTEDERIAWGHFTIPDSVFNGETLDDWFSLSGKQGDDKEGMLHMIIAYTAVTAPPMPMMYAAPGAPMVMVPQQPYYYPAPGMYGVPTQQPGVISQGQQQQQPQQQPGFSYTEEDVKQVQDMFPNIDKEVISSVFEEKHGDKDAVINSLLQMMAE